MDHQKQQTEEAVTAYEQMQLRHFKALAGTELPDLNAMNEERDKTFANLQNQVENLMANAGSKDKKDIVVVLSEYEDRLNKISQLDAQIEKRIKEHQTRLRGLMLGLKRGKTAMGGYGGINTKTSPHVLSLNQ